MSFNKENFINIYLNSLRNGSRSGKIHRKVLETAIALKRRGIERKRALLGTAHTPDSEPGTSDEENLVNRYGDNEEVPVGAFSEMLAEIRGIMEKYFDFLKPGHLNKQMVYARDLAHAAELPLQIQIQLGVD